MEVQEGLEYMMASSVKEAIDLVSKDSENSRFIAGGTDVMVNHFQGNLECKRIVDISNIDELKQVIDDVDMLRIGSLVRLHDLREIDFISENYPALLLAADAVGSPLIRQTATLGGNILCENRCLFYNQSEWWRESIGKCLKCDGDTCIATGGRKKCYSELVSDTCPVLIALDARLEVVNKNGVQEFNLEDIYTGDGIQPRMVKNTDLVTHILLPVKKDTKVVFKKLRQRLSLEFTSLTTAVSLDSDRNITIAMAGVDPGPVVVRGKSGDNLSDLIDTAIKRSRAIDNDMLTRKYRREMIKIFLEESFEELKITNA